MKHKIKVIVVDDQKLFSDGPIRLLEEFQNSQTQGQSDKIV